MLVGSRAREVVHAPSPRLEHAEQAGGAHARGRAARLGPKEADEHNRTRVVGGGGARGRATEARDGARRLKGAATRRRSTARRGRRERHAAKQRRRAHPRMTVDRARARRVARDLTRKRRVFAPRRTASSSSLMKSYRPIPVPDTLAGAARRSSPRAPCRDASPCASSTASCATPTRSPCRYASRVPVPPRSRPGVPTLPTLTPRPSLAHAGVSGDRPPRLHRSRHATGVAGASSTPPFPLAPPAPSPSRRLRPVPFPSPEP